MIDCLCFSTASSSMFDTGGLPVSPTPGDGALKRRMSSVIKAKRRESITRQGSHMQTQAHHSKQIDHTEILQLGNYNNQHHTAKYQILT